MVTKEVETSEFGKGLTYCLGLFLAHAERDFERYNYPEKYSNSYLLRPAQWFNGAGDHLFELVIPKSLSKNLQKELKDFQEDILSKRNDYFNESITYDDVLNSIAKAKELLYKIDKELGYNPIKSECK